MSLRFVLFDDVNHRYVRGTTNETEVLTLIDNISGADPEEVVTTVSGDAITDYSVAGFFTFDPSNSVRDIEVYRNVGRQIQSDTGDSSAGGQYEKISSTTIRFFTAPKNGDRIIIRKEGTAGGLDLERIGVDPQPSIDAAKDLGTSDRSWNSLYLKDMDNGTNRQVAVSGGSIILI